MPFITVLLPNQTVWNSFLATVSLDVFSRFDHRLQQGPKEKTEALALRYDNCYTNAYDIKNATYPVLSAALGKLALFHCCIQTFTLINCCTYVFFLHREKEVDQECQERKEI